MELKNFHVLRIVYLPCTEKLPGRFKICTDRFKQSRIVSKSALEDDPEYSTTYLQTIANILTREGFVVTGMGNGDGCDYLITETFKPLKIA